MVVCENPALGAFLSELGNELVFAQVLILRRETGFELRHRADKDREEASLQTLNPEDARELARHTSKGAFRPLKSSPNLKTGWRMEITDDSELELVLGNLYPGAIPDWFAARASNPPVTHYREFTARQSGMYRITTMLDDPQAEIVVRAGCDRHFCLKHRMWSVGALPPDLAASKSIIPCLEPCAVLMEFARKAVRIEQEQKLRLEISPDDAEAIIAALEMAIEYEPQTGREADVSNPSNPRRLKLAAEKISPLLKLANNNNTE